MEPRPDLLAPRSLWGLADLRGPRTLVGLGSLRRRLFPPLERSCDLDLDLDPDFLLSTALTKLSSPLLCD